MQFFLLLKSFFDFFTIGLKSALEFVVKYPKQFLIIVACVLALLGGLKIKHDRDEFKAQISQLTTQLNASYTENKQLKLDVQTAVQVNKENQETIQSLSIAATDAKNAVEDMKKTQQVAQTKIVTIREKIAESKPEDDGKVAKVLRDTIDAIQKDREQTK